MCDDDDVSANPFFASLHATNLKLLAEAANKGA
jgi:hypothetical protein